MSWGGGGDREGVFPSAEPSPCSPAWGALQGRILHGREWGQLGHLLVLWFHRGTRGQQLGDVSRHELVGHEGSGGAKNGVDPALGGGSHQPQGIGGTLLGLGGAGVVRAEVS